MVNDEEIPGGDAKVKSVEGAAVMKASEVVRAYAKDINLCIKGDVERLKLVKDIEEIKTKLSELESTLGAVSSQIPYFFHAVVFI